MRKYRAIILAAGQGTRLRPLTDNIPKCMVEINEKPLLKWQIETFNRCGIKDIVVVTGYKREKIPEYDIINVYNEDYAVTNMIISLFCAEKYIEGDVIISYGDIIYSDKVLKLLIENKRDIVIASDEEWQNYWETRCENPLTDVETFIKGEDQKVQSLGQEPDSLAEIEGQFIGLIKLSGKGCRIIKKIYYDCMNSQHCKNNAWNSNRSLRSAYMTDLMNYLAGLGKLHYNKINRGWFEIDNHKDLKIANEHINYLMN